MDTTIYALGSMHPTYIKTILYVIDNIRFPIGDAQVAIAVAIAVASQVLISLLTPTQQIKGSKLQNKDAFKADYGQPIPIVFGTAAVTGNMFWEQPLKEVKEKKKQGKGGGGAVSTEYTYYVRAAYLLAYVGRIPEDASTRTPHDNGVYELVRLLVNDKILWDENDSDTDENLEYFTFHQGGYAQPPDPFIQIFTPDTPAYRGFCYVVFNDLPAAAYGNTFPSVTAVIRRVSDYTLDTRGLLKFIAREGGLIDTPTSDFVNFNSLRVDSANLSRNRPIDGFILSGSGETFKSYFDQIAQFELCGKSIHFSSLATPIDDNPSLFVTSIERSDYVDPQGNLVTDAFTITSLSEIGTYPEDDQELGKPPVNLSEAKDLAELPTNITVDFYDKTKNFNRNSVSLPYSFPNASGKVGASQSFQTDLVMQPSDATAISSLLLSQIYTRNRVFQVSLSPKHYGRVRPLHSITLPTDGIESYYVQGQVLRLRLGSDFSTELNCVWYASTSGQPPVVYTDPSYNQPPTSNNSAKPPIVAFEGVPQNYTSSTPFGVWVGYTGSNLPIVCTIYYRVNNGAWVSTGTTLSSSATVGTIDNSNTMLAPADQYTPDQESVFRVNLTNTEKDLDPISQTQFNEQSDNLVFLDRELVTFRDATFISTGVYTLSHLWRGMRNTSQEIPNTPRANAYFVSQGGFAWVSIPASGLNQIVDITAVGGNVDPNDGQIVTLPTFQGLSYKPARPENLQSRRRDSGNVVLSWSLVDLFAQEWSSGTDQQLNNPLTFTIRLYNGSTVIANIDVVGAIEYEVTASELTSYGATLGTTEFTVTQYNNYLAGYESEKQSI